MRKAQAKRTPLEADRAHFRLVITRQGASGILVSTRRPRRSLPQLEVGTNVRVAEQLIDGILQRYGLKTYCLVNGSFKPLPDLSIPHRYAVMELLSPSGETPCGTTWLPFDRAASDATLSLADRAVMAASLEDFREPHRGPFARPGWIEELFAWVQHQIAPLGLRLTGEFNQLNASSSFSLLRIGTTGEPVWFKATGEPNTHELSLSLSLAHLFPTYVPPMIAIRPVWNGWLSQHVAGAALGEITHFSAWERAAEDLAQLQISSIGKTTQLLVAGAKDLRIGRIAERIDAFVSRVSELMALQEKRSPAPLVERDLKRLADALRQSCTLLEEFGLPHTLGHLDLNPGNILVTGDHCVFLDWAEGSIANPLLTFEYLAEHMLRSELAQPASFERLLGSYLHPWAGFFSPEELRRARELSPLVAVFAYATANDSWRSPDLVDNPQRAGYFRALTRRMCREVTRLEERSERCLTT